MRRQSPIMIPFPKRALQLAAKVRPRRTPRTPRPAPSKHWAANHLPLLPPQARRPRTHPPPPPRVTMKRRSRRRRHRRSPQRRNPSMTPSPKSALSLPRRPKPPPPPRTAGRERGQRTLRRLSRGREGASRVLTWLLASQYCTLNYDYYTTVLTTTTITYSTNTET